MNIIFNQFGTLLYTAGSHHCYRIKFDIISAIAVKWSRNRDPDQVRVVEMLEYYRKGGYLPPMLHLAELPGEGLVCYDGNHRREVFKQLPPEFVIVDIVYNATNDSVYDLFHNINKAVQVPAIYLDDIAQNNIKDNILKLVKKYETKYKGFLSASNRPFAPNFNRDNFVESLYDIYKKLGKYTVEQIADALEYVNGQYSEGKMCKPHTYYKSSIVEKCEKYGLWLFIDRGLSIEHIKLALLK